MAEQNNAGALAVLAEALARVEFKLDVLLLGFALTAEDVSVKPMASRYPCPVCLQTVQYQADIVNLVVKRVCGCKTGIQPPSSSLFPVTPEPTRAPADPEGSRADAEDPEDRPRRQGR